MMFKELQYEKGVTLIELLAVMTILSIILITISSVQIQFLKTVQDIKVGSFQNDKTAFFTDLLKQEVRNAAELTVNEDNILIIKESGETLMFVYDKENKKISLKRQDGVNMEILTGVEEFHGTLLKEKDVIGIQLDISLVYEQRKFPIELIAYSYIGKQGN